jgi:hypothetical protein
MTNWSLCNIFRQVSHRQFMNYTERFKAAVEYSSGMECRLQISVLKNPKIISGSKSNFIQEIVSEVNKNNTLLKTETLTDITADIWKKAGYVEITLIPASPDKNQSGRLGRVEFKGRLPRQATFEVNDDIECVKQSLLSWKYAGKIDEDPETNCTRIGLSPPSF